jgi:hypothetical protein
MHTQATMATTQQEFWVGFARLLQLWATWGNIVMEELAQFGAV